MGKVLIKDLVIPKGTIFSEDESEKFTAIIGLSDDTFGEVTYYFDKSIDKEQKEELEEYFIDIKE